MDFYSKTTHGANVPKLCTYKMDEPEFSACPNTARALEIHLQKMYFKKICAYITRRSLYNRTIHKAVAQLLAALLRNRNNVSDNMKNQTTLKYKPINLNANGRATT